MTKEGSSKKDYEKIEKNLIRGTITLGILLIVTAILMPFIVRDYYKPKIENYKTIAELGSVGDFIGGTTVAFLTAASVLLLLATIIMQRREIKISQEGIVQLVEQTKASIEQAEAARKETQITNETMKRQQFETTFFNMVTLHHNNTEKLRYKEAKGTEVIKGALSTFSDFYYDLESTSFKMSYLNDDYNEVVDFIEELKMHKIKDIEHVQTSMKDEVTKSYENLDFRELSKEGIKVKMVRDFHKYAYQNPKEASIIDAYKGFETFYDRILNSYYSSLTTIIRFLSESEFERSDKENNTENNKIYREVLFSQLSPHELILLYYFAKYSSSNNWLLDELKTYNSFYPRLSDTLYQFFNVDTDNVNELINSTNAE